MKVVNSIDLSKEIRIKNNATEWFNKEDAALIHAHEKFLLNFKTPKLHIDE